VRYESRSRAGSDPRKRAQVLRAQMLLASSPRGRSRHRSSIPGGPPYGGRASRRAASACGFAPGGAAATDYTARCFDQLSSVLRNNNEIGYPPSLLTIGVMS
jgi:hypothetical protein